jgi:hypothetical protein
MKSNKIWLLFVLCISQYAEAQVSKIYGYNQYLYGGAMQMNNTEDRPGNEKPMQSVSTRYFIFVVIEKNKTIIPQQLWIDKQLYNFTLDTIKQFPFILVSSEEGERTSKDTLVKSSAGSVIQLKNPIAAKLQIIPKSIRKMVHANALVFIYRYKGRVRKIFIQHLQQVSPIFAP